MWYATVLLGFPTAVATSLTLAARSWSRPSMVVRNGWLTAWTCIGDDRASSSRSAVVRTGRLVSHDGSD